MNASAPDLRNPMSGDVLEPFVEEWAERARKAQEAIDALASGEEESSAPRIERRRVGKSDRNVLVRKDGDESRLITGNAQAKAVTVVFSAREWALIVRTVLRQHGLSVIDNADESAEG